MERKKNKKSVKKKKVNASEIEGSRRRGRPVVRWKDRVKEYMHERGADRSGMRGEGGEHARSMYG